MRCKLINTTWFSNLFICIKLRVKQLFGLLELLILSTCMISVALFLMSLMMMLNSIMSILLVTCCINISRPRSIYLNFISYQTSCSIMIDQAMISWISLIELINIILLNLFRWIHLLLNSMLVGFPLIDTRDIDLLPVVSLTCRIVAAGSEGHGWLWHLAPPLKVIILILVCFAILPLVSQILGIPFGRCIFCQDKFGRGLTSITELFRDQCRWVGINLGMREMSRFVVRFEHGLLIWHV